MGRQVCVNRLDITAEPARVLLGSYGGQSSPIPAPSEMANLEASTSAEHTRRLAEDSEMAKRLVTALGFKADS